MRIQDKNSKLMSGGKTNTSITIHTCAESGDLVGFQRLLRYNPSLLNDRSNLMSETPLHIAASLNRVEIMKYLLDGSGAGEVELEAKNVYGETPLHEAAKNGCNEALRKLLDQGANVEARTNNSITPLHLAVGYALRTGDNSTVKTLSEYNADCSAEDDEGMIPFNYLPAGIQNEELLKLVCQNVANQIQSATQQIYNTTTGHPWTGHQDVVELSSYDAMDYSSSSYLNVEEPMSSESGIKGKMDEFNYELSKMVGLHDLKQQLQKWAKGMLLDERRRAMGLNLGPRKPPHMAFLGNPGTGKTTVARIFGKLLHSVGVLSSDSVTQVRRTDLVEEYIGQTGPKTRKKIQEAMGGILFVDEAYRLMTSQTAGDQVDYGVEALEEIMSVLEDGNLVLIFAGYAEPMKGVFSSNEGFRRRVTHFFQFDDFTCKDLADMLMIKMSKQEENSRLYGFRLHPSCTHAAVLALIEKNTTEKLRNKMNGGLVDQMLNYARENLDSRLTFDSKGDELLTITLGDLEAGLRLLSQRVNVR